MIFLIFTFGFITSVFYHAYKTTLHPEPIASLEIVNKTSQNIKEISIELIDGSSNPYGTIKYYNLNKDKTMRLPMYFERDGSYRVKYTLEDGIVFISDHAYVMKGDVSFERVDGNGANVMTKEGP